jgi:hypothetical protein
MIFFYEHEHQGSMRSPNSFCIRLSHIEGAMAAATHASYDFFLMTMAIMSASLGPFGHSSSHLHSLLLIPGSLDALPFLSRKVLISRHMQASYLSDFMTGHSIHPLLPPRRQHVSRALSATLLRRFCLFS